MNRFVVLLGLAAVACASPQERKPLYKYRYATEDVMQTAASSVPLTGYHVVEGGYYPSEIGYGGVGVGGGGIGVGGGAGLGYGGAGLGYGKYIGGAGIGGGGIGYGGGEYLGGGGIGLGGAGRYIGGGGGQFIGGGGKFIGGGGGGQFIGGGGGGQFIGGGGGQFIGGGGGGAGLIGAPYHHGYGGELVDKNIYSGEKKNLNDESYKKASGKEGGEVNQGKEGYTKGIAAAKNAKGESEYYNDQGSGKKLVEDGKNYYGGQHFDKEGKQGGEVNEKSGHKKGHKIKGFKTSHHKDETGKTEEFYDEENDEGGKLNFNGQSGSFGEKGASSFKGGHENEEEALRGHKKAGHFDNEHIVDNSNADEGKYGENKYAGGGSVYGYKNGVDQQSLLGANEESRFYKHHPYHVPFY